MATWNKMQELMWCPCDADLDFLKDEAEWEEQRRIHTSKVRKVPKRQWAKYLKERKE